MKTRELSKSQHDLARQCAGLINKANRIAALTGAGISTSVGIPDFRGPQGLYTTGDYDPDTIFDIQYFRRDPEPFYAFAKDFIDLEERIFPTFTHYFLARLEKKGKLSGTVTQNIDGLHQKAGSRHVVELHGSITKSFCMKCGVSYSYDFMKSAIRQKGVPTCACGGIIKPDIVFFGENVKNFSEASRLASEADLFFVIGTSCVVYPAAVIPTFVGGDIIVVNNDPVSLDTGHVVLSIETDIDLFFRSVEQYGSQSVNPAR